MEQCVTPAASFVMRATSNVVRSTQNSGSHLGSGNPAARRVRPPATGVPRGDRDGWKR